MRFVYKPPQFDLLFSRRTTASVGCLGRAGVSVERGCVCADRFAASLCAGRHSRTQPPEPAQICAGVFRHSGTAALGLDVSGGEGSLVGTNSCCEADIRKAEVESGFCRGVDRNAWGRRPGRGKLTASHAQRWKPVPSAKLDHLSHLFFDPGDTCCAGSFFAMASTHAWIISRQRTILRRRRGQAPAIAGGYRLPERTQEVGKGST